MTIEEYSTRMGYLGFPSDEEYVKANLAYMMAGNMDKDQFCKDYRKHKDSVIIATLADAANSRDIAYRDKQTKERQTAHALLREADEIRQGGMEASADAIDKIAATLIGRKDCIKWKLYNRKNEMSIFQKRNEQIFSFFASFFLLLFRPLKHQLKADFKPLKQA